ncbi:hypothetical protein [Ferrimonas pelagia]|uniref:Outer membrane protein beta-barrel domain-containing protein n=1 Tax=Ferrimonas pelagia TaxID=1177826 RepID=A0ABP9F6Q9_9GAMM
MGRIFTLWVGTCLLCLSTAQASDAGAPSLKEQERRKALEQVARDQTVSGEVRAEARRELRQIKRTQEVASGVNKSSGFLYLGVKPGEILTSKQLDNYFDGGKTVGFYAGYGFNEHIAVEYERFSGELKYPSSSSKGPNYNTQGVYAAFRSGDEIYYKLRGGFVDAKVGSGYSASSDTGLSFGVGGGINFDALQIELEYTVVDQDASYLSLGLGLRF